MKPTHRYSRSLEGIGPDDSLRGLAAWVPHGATVLELGPASGYFSRYLREELECTIDAVEINQNMAEGARPFCRQLVIGDLAVLDLAAVLTCPSYDVIIAADVVEHLAEPEALLRRLRPLLQPDGRLLLSVPNVAYAGLVAALLDGRFEYRDEGLLDRTHLRFFTRESLFAMLEAEGFHVDAHAPVFRPLNESEFKVRVEVLPAVLRDTLLTSPHALCYQWLVNAGLNSVSPRQALSNPTNNADAFPLRAHYGLACDPPLDVQEAVSWGRIGEERQTVSIVLPAMARGPIRFYPSDRPGFMRLFAMSLRVGDELLWSWRAKNGADELTEVSEGLSFAPADDHLLATLHLPHAWLQLKATDFLSSRTNESLLEVELGWPMSADYMVAAHGWSQAVSELSVEVERLRRQLATQASEGKASSCRCSLRHWLRQGIGRFRRPRS